MEKTYDKKPVVLAVALSSRIWAKGQAMDNKNMGFRVHIGVRP